MDGDEKKDGCEEAQKAPVTDGAAAAPVEETAQEQKAPEEATQAAQ